jgi:hypothetical protein
MRPLLFLLVCAAAVTLVSCEVDDINVEDFLNDLDLQTGDADVDGDAD